MKKTAFTKYERLEAVGIWRPGPQAQRREVLLKVGEATLVISDLNGTALSHWSLASIRRMHATNEALIYFPDGDPDETVEIGKEHTEFIESFDLLQEKLSPSVVKRGGLRALVTGGILVALICLCVFWLPPALISHAIRLVPEVTQRDISRDLLERMERLTGSACDGVDAQEVTTALAERVGATNIVILPQRNRQAISFPDGTILLSRELVENYEGPEVAAGFAVAEQARSLEVPPLQSVLEYAGLPATVGLLASGRLSERALDGFAEFALSSEAEKPSDDAVIAQFIQRGIPITPYARAIDPTGETSWPLIEADPFKTTVPVMTDLQWLRLQRICE